MVTTDGADESPLNPPKKRKRQRVVMDDDEDNQTHDPLPHCAVAAADPPPNFFASSFTWLNHGHSLANEENPMAMAEIIQKANSATGMPSGIKSYSSFMKGSRSTLGKIAPLLAHRKTPPPLPPKLPLPKKPKKQLELGEKSEEESEEIIEG